MHKFGRLWYLLPPNTDICFCYSIQLRPLIFSVSKSSGSAVERVTFVTKQENPSNSKKIIRVMLVTASPQLRTVLCALLRQYSPVVATGLEAATKIATTGDQGGGFSAAVVDLDLVHAVGCCAEDRSQAVGALRTALWGEPSGSASGLLIGISAAVHSTAAPEQKAQNLELLAGIDRVLKRWVHRWATVQELRCMFCNQLTQSFWVCVFIYKVFQRNRN